MKSFIALLSLTIIYFNGFAQSFTFTQGGTTDKHYYNETPYETLSRKIFLYVEIAGKRRKFLFDTGAPTAINKELAAELKFNVLHKVLVSDALGIQDSVSIVSVKRIKIGNVTFNDIPAVTIIPDFLKCWNIEGVVGSNILRNSIVRIVPDKHLIIITDNEDTLSLKNKINIPLTENNYSQNFPTIKILLKDKVNVEFGFDTGDPGFLSLSEDYMRQLNQFNVYQVLSKGYGSHKLGGFGLQKNDSTYRLKIDFLKIGDSKFDNVITETDKNGVSRIGSKLLDYGAVTLDFINRKFYFEATNAKNDLNEKQWPLRPVINDHKLLVGTVWAKLVDQIKPGQQITAINDIAYDKIDLCDWIHNKSVFDNKEKIILKIKDERGKIKIVQVMKE
jgi:hypothetical protein